MLQKSRKYVYAWESKSWAYKIHLFRIKLNALDIFFDIYIFLLPVKREIYSMQHTFTIPSR